MPAPDHSVFYRSDALPEQCQSTEGTVHVTIDDSYLHLNARLSDLFDHILQILPTVAFLFFFRTDSMDSPDCLPILLSISLF